MMHKDLLKKITILYVDDNEDVRNELSKNISFIFKKVYTCCDGLEASNIFSKYYSDIDMIISDINMPNINGLELLERIRKIDKKIPFIILSAYNNVECMQESIKLNVSEYISKPVDLMYLVKRISILYKNHSSVKKVKQQTEEISRYLDALNKVAIVSKTTPKGIITYVNDIFCDVSQYSREELVGESHNIVRHPDMPSAAFKELWTSIKMAKTWQGKVKNKAKFGSSYYVNATIIPLFDDMGKEIIEYIGIRFLTTNDELEKREFKRKVVVNLQETRKRESEKANHILLLENKLKRYENVSLVEEALNNERVKSRKLRGQILYYEDEIKNEQNNSEKLVKIANDKLYKAGIISDDLKKENKELSFSLDNSKFELNEKAVELIKTKERIESQNKIIRDLKDVINFREKELKRLKD